MNVPCGKTESVKGDKRMEYKIGDKVRVRSDLEVGEKYGGMTWLEGMKRGDIGMVTDVSPTAYQLDNRFWYSPEMICNSGNTLEEIEEEIRAEFEIGDFVKLKDGAVDGSQFTDYPISPSEVFTTPQEVRDYDPYDDTVYLSNDNWYHIDALEKVIITPTVTATNIALDGSVPSLQDAVNSPSHYTSGEVETIDYIQDKLNDTEFDGYCKGNALKYVSRASLKNGEEDIKKAIWYLRFMLGDDPRKDKE